MNEAMMKPRWFVASALALALCCRLVGEARAESIALPSGHSVEVVSTGVAAFTSGGAHALQVEYVTKLSVDDAEAVQAESAEVWSILSKRMDASGVETVIVRAKEPPVGSTAWSRTTVFKLVGGKWDAGPRPTTSPP